MTNFLGVFVLTLNRGTWTSKLSNFVSPMKVFQGIKRFVPGDESETVVQNEKYISQQRALFFFKQFSEV